MWLNQASLVLELFLFNIAYNKTRYQTNVSKYPYFTKMTFIQADATVPLIANLQEKKIPTMTPDSKK